MIGSGITFRDSFSVQEFGSGIHSRFRDLVQGFILGSGIRFRDLYLVQGFSNFLKGIILSLKEIVFP